MFHTLRDAIIAEVRRHDEEGDCRTAHYYSIETLEQVILDLATAPAVAEPVPTVVPYKIADASYEAAAHASRFAPAVADVAGLVAIPRPAKRLYGHPDYLDDPEGLERFRQTVLETRDWHDMAPINCNSLARLIDTIDRLSAFAADALEARTHAGDREAIASVCAREMCKASGEDPDSDAEAGDPIGNPATYPAWMLWLPEGRKVADAILALSPTHAEPSTQPVGDGEAMHVIDRDRYVAAACLNRIESVLRSRSWLLEPGRGSYAYDDDRYQAEFGLAFDEIQEALGPLRRLAKDKSGCATDPEKVQAARSDGAKRFAALSTLPTDGSRECRTVEQGVIPAGMKAWSGGDSAPDDWDGGLVWLQEGRLGSPRPNDAAWKHAPVHSRGHWWNVIAYTPAASMKGNERGE